MFPLALLLALVYWAPAFVHFSKTGFGDWQWFHHHWEAGRVALLRFGELPLWDPFHCGGVFLFGDPQAQIYSPLFYLLLPLGTTLGLKVFLVLHTAVGLLGMYYYCRSELRCGSVAAASAALVWGWGGFFAWHGSGGHSTFLPFYFTPWLLLAWGKTIRDVRYATAVAGLMALTLFEGGVYPFSYLCLLLAFEAGYRLLRREERPGVVRGALVTIPLLILLGGARLLPIIDTLAHYPRPTIGDDSVSLREVVAMLTARKHPYVFGHPYVWAEYGSFVGWPTVGLALLGMFPLVRKRPAVLAGALLFGGLMLGSGSPWHPWSLLHHLPYFGSLRVPSRFAVLFTFYVALMAAGGVDQLVSWLGRHEARGTRTRRPWTHPAASWAVPIALAADLLAANVPIINRWTSPPLPKRIVSDEPYHLVPLEQYGSYASFPALGVGSRGCYSGLPYRPAPGLWEGRRDQVYIEGRRGDLVADSRTANTISAEVILSESASVVFNQTWARGWTSSQGEVGSDALGRIAIDLAEGHHAIELAYRPPLFFAGWIATAAGVLALVLILARLGHSSRRRPGPEPKDHP